MAFWFFNKAEDGSLSLKLRLLRRIVPPLLLMVLITGWGGYFIIRRHGVTAYDEQMADIAFVLSRYVTVEAGNSPNQPDIQVNLTPDVEDTLRTDRYDTVFWAVRNERGQTIAGDEYLPDTAEDVQIKEGGRFFLSTVRGAKVRVGMFQHRIHNVPVTIIVAETRNKRRQLAFDIALGMLIPEILLGIGLVWVVWYGVGKALTPLEDLRRDIKARSHTDLRPLAVLPLVEEVQPLVSEINQLLLRLQDGAASQQRFIANAAHQLRTPLAGLKTQLELALADERPEQRLQRLEQCHNATERTARLVNQLLALSSAEPGGRGEQPWQHADWVDILKSRADEWVRRSIDCDLDFGLELSSAPVLGDPLLLGELAANLVDNAFSYTPRGGRVTLRCGVREGMSFVDVVDNGPGIPQVARKQVLERFYRLPGSQGIGSGLGLAIVSEIAERHSALVSIADAPDEAHGTWVQVSFPPFQALPVARLM